MIKQGMSLIEIMIGVILLALIVVPSLNVINTKTQSVTATRDHQQAAFVAQKVQETARAFKFDLIEADRYAGDTATQQKTFEWLIKNSDELKKHSLNGIDYLIEDVEITPAINQSNPDPDQTPILLFFKFTVKYTGKDKREHRLIIDTAISRRE